LDRFPIRARQKATQIPAKINCAVEDSTLFSYYGYYNEIDEQN
jgi:hypothetical protein